MITATGKHMTIHQESDPELMQLVRSSYGLLGVVYEVTMKVVPNRPLAVRYETFDLAEFQAKLPLLVQNGPKMIEPGESMTFFLFPFDNKVSVEFRQYNDDARGRPDRYLWNLRNFFWKTAISRFSFNAEETIDDPITRYAMIDRYIKAFWMQMERLRSENTVAADQIMQYSDESDNSRYDFSLWALPVEQYAQYLGEYFLFCHKYYEQHGYRTNMSNMGYYVLHDQSSLLSYTFDDSRMTIDPVSTGNEGWEAFLEAFNEFASERGGKPLFNQTPHLTHEQVKRAFGDRLGAFELSRKDFDPNGRMLNVYYQELLQGSDQ